MSLYPPRIDSGISTGLYSIVPVYSIGPAFCNTVPPLRSNVIVVLFPPTVQCMSGQHQ